jgi:hypothetical protein
MPLVVKAIRVFQEFDDVARKDVFPYLTSSCSCLLPKRTNRVIQEENGIFLADCFSTLHGKVCSIAVIPYVSIRTGLYLKHII